MGNPYRRRRVAVVRAVLVADALERDLIDASARRTQAILP